MMNSVMHIRAFLQNAVKNRFTIAQLVRRDLKERYLGSYLGSVWPVLQQLLMVLIMGFVLESGLRVTPILGFPFLVWLITAQSIFFFFNEATISASQVFVQYSYLVKKVQFQVSLLPFVKILVALVNHAIFMAITIVFLFIFGVKPSLYWFQAFYYLFAGSVFILGLVWLLSSLTVFIRDISQIVGIVVTFLVWVTPIFWDTKNAKGVLATISWFNPIAYLTEGYRDSFLYARGFWLEPYWTLYFWSVTLVLLGLGAIVFRRLRPHFSDVL